MITIILSVLNFILLISILALAAKMYYSNRDAIERVLYPKIARAKEDQRHLEEFMKLVKEGKTPALIGFSLTQEQFDELIPYVKNEQFLNNVLKPSVLLRN